MAIPVDGLNRVLKQINKYPFDLFPVNLYLREGVCKIFCKTDILVGAAVEEDHISDDCIDIVDRRLRGRHSCKTGELVYQHLECIYLSDDCCCTIVKNFIIVLIPFIMFFPQPLCTQLNRGQGVFNLMGQVFCHLLPCRDPLYLDQL